MMLPVYRTLFAISAGLVLAMSPCSATGQVIGPLTGRVGTSEPTEASFRVGPVLVASGVNVQSIGIDNNVFDESENPKRDFHAIITPDLTMYLRTGLMRFTVASAADFTYYQDYTSERGINRAVRGRVDFLLSRFRPFVGGATVETRERPNAEIDLRAERSERELIGGVGFEVSPLTYIFAGVTRTDYLVAADEIYRGVSLSEELDHKSDSVSIGLRRDLTPLTTMQLTARVARDRFDRSSDRDSDLTEVQTLFTFAPDALWSGELSAGYQVFDPNDPRLEPYRGLTLGGRIQWPIFPATRLDITVDRRVQYSFEEAEAYYIDTGTTLTVTQRVIGNFDVQTRGSYRRLAYTNAHVPSGVDPNDRVISALAGVGYTLRDDSRVGFNYEFTNRESERRRDRVFDRHRVYGSWTHKF